MWGIIGRIVAMAIMIYTVVIFPRKYIKRRKKIWK